MNSTSKQLKNNPIVIPRVGQQRLQVPRWGRIGNQVLILSGPTTVKRESRTLPLVSAGKAYGDNEL